MANANVSDCQNLYVGKIWVEKGTGLAAVVYLNNRGDASGSYWSSFYDWEDADKKEVYSLLLAAKMSNHRVNVVTEGGCTLNQSGNKTKTVYLTSTP